MDSQFLIPLRTFKAYLPTILFPFPGRDLAQIDVLAEVARALRIGSTDLPSGVHII